jgi:phage terminase large subunit-like protein
MAELAKREALIELARRESKRSLLAFMRWVWWMPHPFVVGTHTRAICDRLTRAGDDFEQGKSTFLLVAVPFRHGKSDIVSRAFPAYFLGRYAHLEPDVIMSGYGAKLVQGFSKKVKKIINSPQYQALFGGVVPGHGTNSISEWQIKESAGTVLAQGLGGSLAGFGGNFICVDDYCKNRSEAASKVYRDKTWDSFRNDLLTRQNAPASIVVVCATPWHVDDLRGRIRNAMKEDPDFPQFEELNFPARKEGVYEYLFPERFSPAWYKAQRSALGRQAAALLDCDPRVEGSGLFDTSKVVMHYDLQGWPVGRETRGWDLASSSKERNSDNPDRTWGVRGLVKTNNLGFGAKQREIWIKSMVFCREEAPKRDKLIVATATADGPGVGQHIEAFGAYKDAYTTMKNVLNGVSIVHKSHLPGDKSAKLAPLEPSFDAGLVHVYVPGCQQALELWNQEFADFPNGGHDDGPDATAVMYHSQQRCGLGALI